MDGLHEMASDPKEIVDGAVYREKALNLSWRLKSAQTSLRTIAPITRNQQSVLHEDKPRSRPSSQSHSNQNHFILDTSTTPHDVIKSWLAEDQSRVKGQGAQS